MSMSVTITLTSNSTAGPSIRRFKSQSVEIEQESRTLLMSGDSHLSIGRHEAKILWHGGTAKDLERVTDVKLVGSDEQVLVQGELSPTKSRPRDVKGGVEFFVI